MISAELENLVRIGRLKREPQHDERLLADLIDAAGKLREAIRDIIK